MKKAVLILLVFAVLASGCGKKKKNEADAKADFQALVKTAPQTPNVIDVKENMFITQLNDIGLNYKSYLGQTVKIQGMFKETNWDGRHYCFVYRRTPGCCGDDGEAGFELSWDPNYQGNDMSAGSRVYPEKDEWVEVQGVLKSYVKSGYPFLYLALSEINVLDDRGAEFVTR